MTEPTPPQLRCPACGGPHLPLMCLNVVAQPDPTAIQTVATVRSTWVDADPLGPWGNRRGEAFDQMLQAVTGEARRAALKEATERVQAVYDLQCPVGPEEKYVPGARWAHQWWETVLGSALADLRSRFCGPPKPVVPNSDAEMVAYRSGRRADDVQRLYDAVDGSREKDAAYDAVMALMDRLDSEVRDLSATARDLLRLLRPLLTDAERRALESGDLPDHLAARAAPSREALARTIATHRHGFEVASPDDLRLADHLLSTWFRPTGAPPECTCGIDSPNIECPLHGQCAGYGHPCHCDATTERAYAPTDHALLLIANDILDALYPAPEIVGYAADPGNLPDDGWRDAAHDALGPALRRSLATNLGIEVR